MSVSFSNNSLFGDFPVFLEPAAVSTLNGMAFYQNHVQKLCADAGIPLSRHGCPILGPDLTAKVMELNSKAADVEAGLPTPHEDASGFTQCMIKAMFTSALNELVNHAPKASKFATKFATEVFQTVPSQVDSYEVPIPVRIAQQDVLRSVHKTLTAALMFKGPGSEGEPFTG